MTTMVGLNIVIAAALGFLAVLCLVASIALRRNAALAWLAAALAVGTTQTLILTFVPGTVFEFISAMAMAPLGFWLANEAIQALMPAERRWRRTYQASFFALCGAAVLLLVTGAPFLMLALTVQLACALAMVDATLRIASAMKLRLLDLSLLAAVTTLALLRLARLPLLVWYFGPSAEFADFNGSALELALLGVESLLTLCIITLVVTVIIADTIATFRHQSERDSLTGLLNRRALDDLAALPLAHGGAVIFCDIDHFKRVNDRFGHQVGDNVIFTFGTVIGRTGYAAGRFGGEEFVVVMPERSLQEAADLAEMMRARFGGSAHHGMPASERVTASFGVAEVRAGMPSHSAFARADAALYMAKNSGRNRVVSASDIDPLPERPSRTRNAA